MEIRYGGKPAAILRGFRALYLALPINSIIMGWVTLAMAKIIATSTGLDKWPAVLICVVVTLSYSLLSGLWGVVVTDFFQFFIALIGAILLAIFAIDFVGGYDALMMKLDTLQGGREQVLSFLPDVGSAWMPLSAVFVYLAVNWWASWYPGSEPGGGGMWPRGFFPPKTKDTVFSPPCGSMSPTIQSAPGPGLWLPSLPWSPIRIWQTRNPVMC
jgi:Na+/proline symporter